LVDLAMGFVWKGFEALPKGGVLACLAPLSILTSEAALTWREALADQASLCFLGHFLGYGLAPGATPSSRSLLSFHNALEQAFAGHFVPAIERESTTTGAQPHWQVDWIIVSDGYVPPRVRETLTALGELTPVIESVAQELVQPARGGLSISKVHLGMMGWRNEGRMPVSWQHPLRHVATDLRTWATQALSYARDQIVKYQPRAYDEPT
jgi:hypothetical protein